jgi:hypothetical protein
VRVVTFRMLRTNATRLGDVLVGAPYFQREIHADNHRKHL